MTDSDRQLFECYTRRRSVLVAMGFDSYAEYLRSDLWKTIRKTVLKRDRFRCRCCRGKATEAHHREYTEESLSGLDTSTIVSVCRACHVSSEFDGIKKVPVSIANNRMNQKARALRNADAGRSHTGYRKCRARCSRAYALAQGITRAP